METTEQDVPRQVRVYRYGLLSPVDWGEDCDEQMWRMNDFWNRLVEIERAHREKYRLTVDSDPRVVPVLEEYQRYMTQRTNLLLLRKQRRKTARAKVPTPDIDEELSALRPSLKEVGEKLYTIRREVRGELKPQLDEAEKERRAAVKALRQQVASEGLWWGNYNAIIADFDVARLRVIKTGRELRFHSYDGSGRFTNQISNGGIPVPSLMQHGHSQVDVILGDDPDVWKSRPRSPKRAAVRAVLRATVYARGRGSRRDVRFPMLYHRPLPMDAIVKMVEVTRRRVADKWEWDVCFTVTLPAPTPRKTRRAVGIDVGWRKVPEGLRVATIAAPESEPRFIILPIQYLALHDRVAEYAQSRDRLVNDHVAALKEVDWSDAPEELREYATKLLNAPRQGPRAMMRLLSNWRKASEPPEGATEGVTWNPAAFAQLVEWSKEDRYIWRLHAGLTRRLTRRRRDIYRNVAAVIARDYDLVGVEQLAVKNMLMAESRAGDDPFMAKPLRRLAMIASPADFINCVRNAVIREGGRLVLHKGQTAMLCHECGVVSEQADRSEAIQVCAHCSAVWDQNVNAAINLSRIAAADESSTSHASVSPRAARLRAAREKALAEATPPG